MTATSHALTGAVIALSIKQPVLAIPLALISHFVTDMIPHFDLSRTNPGLTRYTTAFDLLLASTLVILIPLHSTESVSAWITFTCMVVAMIPDSVWGWRYFKYRDFNKVISAQPISRFSLLHQKIQWSESTWGIIPEVFWLLLMGVLIYKL